MYLYVSPAGAGGDTYKYMSPVSPLRHCAPQTALLEAPLLPAPGLRPAASRAVVAELVDAQR